MAEKMSTLVLKVNPDCNKCYNKIRKTLCQFHYEIRSQTWEKKQNIVTISGPFDPQNMSKMLASKAGKAIKSIEIKGDGKKGDEKPKPKEPEKPAGGDKPASDKKPDKKPEGGKSVEKPPEKAAEAPKAAEPAKAAGMKMYEPMTVVAYPVAQQPYGVYYQGYEGYEGAPPPPYYHGYGRPVYNYESSRGYVHGSDYFSEENPSCGIM